MLFVFIQLLDHGRVDVALPVASSSSSPLLDIYLTICRLGTYLPSYMNLDCIEKESSPGEHWGNDAVLKRSPAGPATPLVLLALLLHPVNEHLMVILKV